MSTPAIRGPVPPYSNINIEPQNYQPRVFVISDVALGVTTTVTTSADHDYVVGQEVRLIIPPTFGCRQLNGKTGFVLSIPALDQIQLDIDSSQNVDSYIASTATTQAQIAAIGDVNTGNINRAINIPGSFIDIS